MTTHKNIRIVCLLRGFIKYSLLRGFIKYSSFYSNVISFGYLSELFQCKDIISGNYHCVYGEENMCILNYANTEL